MLPWHVHIYMLTIILASIAGLIRWHDSSFPLRILTILLLFSVLTGTLSIVLGMRGIRNIFIVHLYLLIAYPLLIFLFGAWHSNKTQTYMRLTIPTFGLSYILFQTVGPEDFQNPPAYSLTIMSILVTVIALYTMYSILKHPPQSIPIYRDQRLWISVGALIYYSSNTLVYSSILPAIVPDVWAIHNILEAIGNTCFLGGFIWTPSLITPSS